VSASLSQAVSPPGSGARARAWLRNPWARARFLWAIAIGYVVWSLAPVALAVAFSFNGGRSLTTWQGFSTRWYCCGISSMWVDAELRSALVQSLKLASLVTVIAVPLGVAFALSLHRWRGRIATSANFTMLLSFITPEIAIGVALLLFFTQLVSGVGLGFPAQVAGLSMYLMPYALIVVRSRLLTIESSYEEAAMDLGASAVQALRRVLLPLLGPAILASAAIVFAASLDNFVISQLLSSGAGTQTIPILIYTSARRGPLPSVNALASVTMFTSTVLVAIAALALRGRRARIERRRGQPGLLRLDAGAAR
jgi:spermidine/putrescine transport system permease protein